MLYLPSSGDCKKARNHSPVFFAGLFGSFAVKYGLCGLWCLCSYLGVCGVVAG